MSDDILRVRLLAPRTTAEIEEVRRICETVMASVVERLRAEPAVGVVGHYLSPTGRLSVRHNDSEVWRGQVRSEWLEGEWDEDALYLSGFGRSAVRRLVDTPLPAVETEN